MTPNDGPPTASPRGQPRNAGRCRRHASPSPLCRPLPAPPGPGGSRAPRPQVATVETACPAAASATAPRPEQRRPPAQAREGVHRLVPPGIGESQLRAGALASPMARAGRYDRPITAPVRPYVARALLVSWRPAGPREEPPAERGSAEADRVGGRQSVGDQAARDQHPDDDARQGGVYEGRRRRCVRPRAARSSSSRPVSSSVRVWRPTMSIAISPTTIAPNAVACQAT